MHTNYYFLKKLVPELKEKIVGLKLMEAFSQDKDELVLGFAAAKGKVRNYKEFFIKAVVSSSFTGLYFSKEFRRARKNSVSLLQEAYDLEVVDVVMVKNDRSFYIQLENDFQILFKLHGNRSNILLLENQEVTFLFNQKLAADNELKIESLEKKLPQNFEAFVQSNGNVKQLFPTFGKFVQSFLDENFPKNESFENQWNFIENLLSTFEDSTFYIVKHESEIHLSLIPFGEILETHQTAIEVSNSYYILYNRTSTIDNEKAVVLRQLFKRKKQTTAYLKTNYERLETIENATKNEQIGHILMANLHQIPGRIAEITLEDFYHQKPVLIKLKEELSAQKNAEYYYRKAKNEKIEVDKLIENIEAKEQDLIKINQFIEEIEAIESLKQLRNYLKISNLHINSFANDLMIDLFKKVETHGFEIWIGKNAKNNDLLTQKFAFKEDLWLHARDTAGSHVIVKYQAGKKFPNQVIEKAAGIAAYHSKRKNEKLVPVIITTKKFVRKIKGMAEGKVKIDKEEVVLVEPVKA